MKVPSWLTATLLWALAFLLAGFSAVFQRVTGPSYPVRGSIAVDGRRVSFRLPRSHGGAGDAQVRLAVPDAALTGTLEYRRYRSGDAWTRQALKREGGALVGWIPHQPPAGKVMYRLRLRAGGGRPVELSDEPVIIRFRGAVPAPVVIAHVAAIFAGMLVSTRAGLEALRKGSRTFGLSVATLAFLIVGGLILGPVMQKYAFDQFWTGWPLGRDLTDNKLAVAVLFWVVAVWRTWRRRTERGWPMVAALVTLAVWFIPHSLLGSELDYTQTGVGT